MLQQAAGRGCALIVLGIVTRLLGIGAAAVTKNRCRTCPHRDHARRAACASTSAILLYEEDDRTHATRGRDAESRCHPERESRDLGLGWAQAMLSACAARPGPSTHARDDTFMIVLTRPPGSGKSALALALAQRPRR